MALEVLIADDEQYVAVYLKKIIEKVEDVKVVAIAGDGKEAVKMVEKLRPQVVCLDIDMPEMNGIAVARELAEVYPQLNFVFVTAYPDYALEAFELYSFDYILKPLDEKRIQKTIRKLKEKVSREEVSRVQNDEKLLIKVDGRKVFADFDEIIYFESYTPKVLIKTIKGEYLIRSSIHELEQHLSKDFFRCHKGYVVNLKYIKEIIPSGRTFEILLKTGDKVLLSREKEKELREKFKYNSMN
ncbi:LytR/AlgR family response regulator transcription factor [Thermincola potens]|uniref:Stage 0 sporulation protein A homolog n=1 Tax=Thermincola potens (strain JR) TaxID=635013 RepID=D5XCR6_THEPJ|nr:LytTR family DNA-binding domain-containing protein [Thermincola potens]ADG83592.1 two component transcriptional regulator, LytTR family [Thermincola potens JR]